MPAPGQTRFSRDDHQKFAAKWEELGSAVKAASFFGVKPYQIRAAVHRLGQKRSEYAKKGRERTRGIPPEMDAAVVAGFKAGATYTGLAQTFGTTTHAVRECIERNGARERRRGPFQKTTPEQKREIFQMFNAGMSLLEMKRSSGLGLSTVRKALSEFGVARIKRKSRSAYINTSGYAEVLVPEGDPLRPFAKADGYMLEHRYVVAKFIGRALSKHETVHHKDGNKLNNSLDNLQLRHGAHGKGFKMRCRLCGSHDLIAEEI